MKKNSGIPKFLQSVLWSYDSSRVDIEEDKEIIITQVLNYGDWKDLKWLYSVYNEDDIREVVSDPKAGLWFERVLNFWEKMLGIHVPKKIQQKAIFSIKPTFC